MTGKPGVQNPSQCTSSLLTRNRYKWERWTPAPINPLTLLAFFHIDLYIPTTYGLGAMHIELDVTVDHPDVHQRLSHKDAPLGTVHLSSSMPRFRAKPTTVTPIGYYWYKSYSMLMMLSEGLFCPDRTWLQESLQFSMGDLYISCKYQTLPRMHTHHL